MRMQVAEHAALGLVRFQAQELGPYPDLQVAQTIGVMRDRVLEDAQDPWFKSRALGIAGSGNDLDKVGRVFEHAHGSIKFQRDETTAAGLNGAVDPDSVVEVIIRPQDMAQYVDAGMGRGDCDDFSMYASALLGACDIPSSFITVAADNGAPDQYSHVYVVAYPMVDGQRTRVACDTSHGDYPGWEVPNAFGKLREWPVSAAACGMDFLGTVVASAMGVWAAWWLWRRMGKVAA